MVDDEDFQELSKHSWCITGNSRMKYAGRGTRKAGKNQKFYMHRVILRAPFGVSVDHIDGNSLNNQRSNLRLCLHKENIRNGKLRTTNKSGYKGVSFIAARKKFAAHIKVDYKSKYLGYFHDAKDAAVAYNKAAKLMFGEFANINRLNV